MKLKLDIIIFCNIIKLLAINFLNMDRIITIKQTEELDRKSGIPFIELMENAGRAVFEEIKSKYKKCKIIVLCGVGNNGGDGYVIARYLKKANYGMHQA